LGERFTSSQENSGHHRGKVRNNAGSASAEHPRTSSRTPLTDGMNCLSAEYCEAAQRRNVFFRGSPGFRKNCFDQEFQSAYGDSPRTSASTSAPNLSILAGPIPDICTRPASSSGRCSAMAVSVVSVNTTYAGTLSCLARLRRHSFSRTSNSSSTSEGQVAQRPSLTSGVLASSSPQIRQRGFSFLGRGSKSRWRAFFGSAAGCSSGTRLYRNRLRLRYRRPPGVRDSAHDRCRYWRTRVTPTYNSRRSSSTALSVSACWIGNVPST